MAFPGPSRWYFRGDWAEKLIYLFKLWICRLPKAVAAHISLLIPHLGGKAYALRSAIVTSVGYLVQNAYSDPPEEEADAQGGPQPRLPTFPHWNLALLRSCHNLVIVMSNSQIQRFEVQGAEGLALQQSKTHPISVYLLKLTCSIRQSYPITNLKFFFD
jgi:hypothetical protein